MGTQTVFDPPTPNTAMLSGDDELSNLTPILPNSEQYTLQATQRRNHLILFHQHLQRNPDTPQSPSPEDSGQGDIFCPYDLPGPSTSAS